MTIKALVPLWFIATLAVASCQSRPEEAAGKPIAPTGQPSADNRFAPTLQELRNGTYQGVAEVGTAFALVKGRWEGKPFEPGAASAPSVTFIGDVRLTADLDGDGAEEAVVLLAAGAGGTGEISYLAVVGRAGGKTLNVATAPIGDRVQVRDAKIDGPRIVLDLVQAGENDAACCPGDLVTRSWELVGGRLAEGAPITTGRLTVATLAGTEWVLKAWARDEAAPASPEVTMKFDGAQVAGNAGCNGYFASVRAGDAPGDLTVGPTGATRRMCPDPEMAVEQRFLDQLAGVRQMRFVGGQLALPYAKNDGSFGVMLFERRPVR
jgi:heat shock protein HslJ